MDEALISANQKGVVGGMTQLHYAAAEIHAMVGNFSRALEELEKGRVLMDKTGEHIGYEPQTALTRARILYEMNQINQQEAVDEEIKELLNQALHLWDIHSAPWLEIQAATLLGRMALKTGHSVDAARERLKNAYAKLTEGFDLPRVREAQEMLSELQAA
jgi:hypothetical protein